MHDKATLACQHILENDRAVALLERYAPGLLSEVRAAVEGILPAYDPDFGDDKLCICGHTYDRHFDPYGNMIPVGCKYCACPTGFTAA